MTLWSLPEADFQAVSWCFHTIQFSMGCPFFILEVNLNSLLLTRFGSHVAAENISLYRLNTLLYVIYKASYPNWCRVFFPTSVLNWRAAILRRLHHDHGCGGYLSAFNGYIHTYSYSIPTVYNSTKDGHMSNIFHTIQIGATIFVSGGQCQSHWLKLWPTNSMRDSTGSMQLWTKIHENRQDPLKQY